jgi:hypothetical protein
LQHYAHWAAADYHAGNWSLGLALALAAVALIGLRRLRPGSPAIFTTLLFATLLSVNHPLSNSRFLHSWVAVLWVAAGVGAARLFDARVPSAALLPPPRLRALAYGAAVALIACHGPAVFRPGHALEGGPRADLPILLPMTDCYLAQLAGARRPVVVSETAFRFLTTWTYLERYGANRDFDTEVKGFGGGDDRQVFEQWARSSACDALVFIHAPQNGHLADAFFPVPGYERLPAVLAAQSLFRRADGWSFPEIGCEVTLWKRNEPGTAVVRRD